MIKAVIFDVDGVLFDSLEANYVYVADLFSLIGLPKLSKKEFQKKFYYQPTREIIKQKSRLEDLAEIEKLIEAARPKITRHFKLLKLFKDCDSILKKLSKDYKLGLATSRSKAGLKHYFEFAKTQKYFKAIVGLHHVRNHKPHPEPILLACKKLKVKPSQAIYIGDAPTDLKAAKAAGTKIIIFGTQLIPGADAYAKNYKDLFLAINKLDEKHI